MSKVYSQAEVDALLAAAKNDTPIASEEFLYLPEVLKLRSVFADLLSVRNSLKEYRLTCDESEYDKNGEELDTTWDKMAAIDQELLGKWDIWISWTNAEIMMFDQKFPNFRTITDESQRAG